MELMSEEELNGNCEGINNEESASAPFIIKDGTKEYFITDLPDLPKAKTWSRQNRILIALAVAMVIAASSFIVGLLTGYLVFGTKNSMTSLTNQMESICSNPPVLLISLDGFKPEYLNRGVTPNILSLAEGGVRAEFMKPSFPSKTFPNHFSIVTGLYPENHGIVDNYFYDRTFRQIFTISSPIALDPKWWLGEPIWVTASKAVLKTGVYFWPGSEVPIEGILPDYNFKYNGSVPYEERIRTVLSWFDLAPTIRPQFMASYFEEPDKSGHAYGPDSEEVTEAVERVDGVVKSYIEGLKARDIYDCVNIVLLSDHVLHVSSCTSCSKQCSEDPQTKSVSCSQPLSDSCLRMELGFSTGRKLMEPVVEPLCNDDIIGCTNGVSWAVQHLYQLVILSEQASSLAVKNNLNTPLLGALNGLLTSLKQAFCDNVVNGCYSDSVSCVEYVYSTQLWALLDKNFNHTNFTGEMESVWTVEAGISDTSSN